MKYNNNWFASCYKGDIDRMRQLLEANVCATDERQFSVTNKMLVVPGFTGLLYASVANRYAIAAVLVDREQQIFTSEDVVVPTPQPIFETVTNKISFVQQIYYAGHTKFALIPAGSSFLQVCLVCGNTQLFTAMAQRVQRRLLSVTNQAKLNLGCYFSVMRTHKLVDDPGNAELYWYMFGEQLIQYPSFIYFLVDVDGADFLVVVLKTFGSAWREKLIEIIQQLDLKKMNESYSVLRTFIKEQLYCYNVAEPSFFDSEKYHVGRPVVENILVPNALSTYTTYYYQAGYVGHVVVSQRALMRVVIQYKQIDLSEDTPGYEISDRYYEIFVGLRNTKVKARVGVVPLQTLTNQQLQVLQQRLNDDVGCCAPKKPAIIPKIIMAKKIQDEDPISAYSPSQNTNTRPLTLKIINPVVTGQESTKKMAQLTPLALKTVNFNFEEALPEEPKHKVVIKKRSKPVENAKDGHQANEHVDILVNEQADVHHQKRLKAEPEKDKPSSSDKYEISQVKELREQSDLSKPSDCYEEPKRITLPADEPTSDLQLVGFYDWPVIEPDVVHEETSNFVQRDYAKENNQTKETREETTGTEETYEAEEESSPEHATIERRSTETKQTAQHNTDILAMAENDDNAAAVKSHLIAVKEESSELKREDSRPRVYLPDYQVIEANPNGYQLDVLALDWAKTQQDFQVQFGTNVLDGDYIVVLKEAEKATHCDFQIGDVTLVTAVTDAPYVDKPAPQPTKTVKFDVIHEEEEEDKLRIPHGLQVDAQLAEEPSNKNSPEFRQMPSNQLRQEPDDVHSSGEYALFRQSHDIIMQKVEKRAADDRTPHMEQPSAYSFGTGDAAMFVDEIAKSTQEFNKLVAKTDAPIPRAVVVQKDEELNYYLQIAAKAPEQTPVAVAKPVNNLVEGEELVIVFEEPVEKLVKSMKKDRTYKDRRRKNDIEIEIDDEALIKSRSIRLQQSPLLSDNETRSPYQNKAKTPTALQKSMKQITQYESKKELEKVDIKYAITKSRKNSRPNTPSKVNVGEAINKSRKFVGGDEEEAFEYYDDNEALVVGMNEVMRSRGPEKVARRK